MAGLAAWAAVIAFGTWAPGALGDEPASVLQDALPLTSEALDARVKQLESDGGMDEGLKKRKIEFLKRAIDDVEFTQATAAKTLEQQQKAAGAEEELKTLKAQLDQPADENESPAPADATLAQLEQLRATAETELAELQKKLVEREAEPKRRADRRVEIPKQLTTLGQQTETLDRELQAATPTDVPADAMRAWRTMQLARRQAIEAEAALLRAELARYDATPAAPPLRRDLAARAVSQKERQVRDLQQLVNERRRVEAADQVRRARRDAANALPTLRQLAESNAELASRRTGPDGLSSRIEEVTGELQAIDSLMKQVRGAANLVAEKVKAAGRSRMTNAVGLLLRKQRAHLPDVRRHRTNIRARQSEIADVELRTIELDDERQRLANINRETDAVVAELGIETDPVQTAAIKAAVRELLETRRDYLDALKVDYDAYFTKLVDLDTAEAHLVSETEEFAAYIDEHVLWIRSAPAIGLGTLSKGWESLGWLTSPTEWTNVGRLLWDDLRGHPVQAALALLLLLAALRLRRVIRMQLREIGEQASKSTTQAIRPTLVAAGLTMATALIWPLLMLFLAWRIMSHPSAAEFAKGVATGLQATALLFLTSESLRQMCRRRGLAEAHFGWSSRSASLVRKNLRWLMLAGLPLGLVVATVQYEAVEARQDSLGRLAFMTGLVLLAIFAQRVFRPRTGVLAEMIARHPNGWLARFQYALYVLAVGAPLSLCAITAVGYYYTSLQLAGRLQATAWLMVGLLVVTAILLRWILIARRKLAIQQARERRAAAQISNQDAAAAGVEVAPQTPPEPSLDLSAVSQQTRKLLQAAIGFGFVLGVWLIWVDVLPALRVLDRVPLWQASRATADSTLGADLSPTAAATAFGAASGGDATTDQAARGEVAMADDSRRPPSLADALLAIVIAAMAVIAGKNIPGLLEITVLQRLPMQSASRFAITTVARYIITVLGVVFTFQTIGVGWSDVQWLVAAISVGLGFGLQEIFGNFVSGLIILFERPVRVGDIVTVGQVSGVVTRIQIRATTICDWDRRELIVPNKDFITGQLVNWTLSDPITRIVLPVGVAYGSDTELTHNLLLKVARESSLVLAEPEPSALLKGFGESTLDFELRVFIPNRDVYAAVVHALNTAIDQAFREHGIEIAFPQRDLHIRSIEQVLPIINEASRPAPHGDSDTRSVA